MQTRRDFLKAALLSAAAAAGQRAWALERVSLGVQLFTVRRQAQGDLPDVLDAIRRIGYQQVETFPDLYTFSAEALRHMIVDAGLQAPSGHFNYQDLGTRFEYATELGVEWMVCSVIPSTMWDSLEGFRAAAKQFNAWAKQAKDMGLRFAFHNHDYEFRPLPGQGGASAGTAEKTGYDVLIDETDPELVFFEVDCYWVAQAGQDPVALMKRLGNRLKLLHLKDRAAGAPSSFDMGPSAAHFLPVGRGALDWKAILAEAQRLGVQDYFVEQDQTKGPPLDALRDSYRYLESIL